MLWSPINEISRSKEVLNLYGCVQDELSTVCLYRRVRHPPPYSNTMNSCSYYTNIANTSIYRQLVIQAYYYHM